MDNKYAIGVDVGGTTTKFGIVNSKGEIISQSLIPTGEYEYVEDFIQELYNKLIPMVEAVGGKKNIKGIGMGAPNGNIYSGTIEYAPNLKWKGIIPMTDLITQKFSLPSKLTNDANAAAVGEMLYGCAKR